MKIWYIYKITNLITSKSYIGQRHIDDSKTSLQDSKYTGSGLLIKKSIKKHGLSNFKKEILKDNIHCQTAANIFEQIFIKKENTLVPNGYNISIGGEGIMTGRCHSKETKLKMSLDRKGRSVSEETRKKISKSNKGHKVSKGTREKLSKSNKGHKTSEETRRKISEACKGRIGPNKGKIMSEEQRQKISQNNGKGMLNRKHTEETKLKMSIICKGRISPRKGVKLTEETKRKISLAHKNKKHSQETKEKMSKNHKSKKK